MAVEHGWQRTVHRAAFGDEWPLVQQRAYGVVRQFSGIELLTHQLDRPDPFRLQHRALIADTVAEVMLQRMNQTHAISFMRQRWDKGIERVRGARFVESAETRLMALHEGSMARYRLRPSEFRAWRAGRL